MPLGFIKVSTKIAPSTSRLAIRKKSAKQLKHTAKLIFSKKNISHELFQEESQRLLDVFDEDHFQAKRCISLIEDPLWKHVCTDIINMMGPLSVLKIWNSRLGSLSPQGTIIDLYCQTEEIAQFTQQYAFVIMGALQRYFPALKELNVKNETKFHNTHHLTKFP